MLRVKNYKEKTETVGKAQWSSDELAEVEYQVRTNDREKSDRVTTLRFYTSMPNAGPGQ